MSKLDQVEINKRAVKAIIEEYFNKNLFAKDIIKQFSVVEKVSLDLSERLYDAKPIKTKERRPSKIRVWFYKHWLAILYVVMVVLFCILIGL